MRCVCLKCRGPCGLPRFRFPLHGSWLPKKKMVGVTEFLPCVTDLSNWLGEEKDDTCEVGQNLWE